MDTEKRAEIFIQKAKEKHGDEYIYDLVVYINTETKVTIICYTHGPFEQTPVGHLASRGCFKCYGSEKSTTESFIEKSRQNHNDNYMYDKVKYINNRTKIIVTCKIHGDFEVIPHSFLRGCGCQECGFIENKNKQIKSTEYFIQKANIKHNNIYDYSKSRYRGAFVLVTVICKRHGEFEISASKHLYGRGCQECSKEHIKKIYSAGTEKFIEKAVKVHGTHKYDYSKVEYINNKTKVTVICNQHGEFSIIPSDHTNGGYGCQLCRKCPVCLVFLTNGNICTVCNEFISNRYKSKEMQIVKFLKESLPDKEFIHNKSVGSDCTGGHLYPDIRFDCLFYNLIVEVDENQHRGASYTCEEKRMTDIIAKLGTPCIFVRYNPDNVSADRNELLDIVKKYLKLSINSPIEWNSYGYKAIYLFYK